jgi:inner membrane protein
VVIVWVVLAVVLVVVEMHHLAFFAAFGALGAAAAAVVAVFARRAVGAQIAVAVAVAAVGVIAVRPFVSRAFARRGEGVVIRGVQSGLIGAQALTLDVVSPQATGHVRYVGEVWLAVPDDAELIPPGTSVIITGVSGTTLAVKAVS